MNDQPKRGGARRGAGRKPTGRTTVNLTVSISPEAKSNIDAAAESRGLSTSALVEKWAKRLKAE
jgi:hypothetical protein